MGRDRHRRARRSPDRGCRDDDAAGANADRGAAAIGEFFATVPLQGRLDEIRLLPTAANRQPALAAYALGDDGKHRPYGLMVLRIDDDQISAIVGFPDPWLFEECGLPPELN